MADYNRMPFHRKLAETLGSDHVYFEPPEGLKIQYPCIVYIQKPGLLRHANNTPYNYRHNYQVTYMTKVADDDTVLDLVMTPMTRFVRNFTADNLHHYVFEMFDNEGGN